MSCGSDNDDEDFSSDNGKKKNVTSTAIKHGTKVAKFLSVLTNGFDLTYKDVKDLLISNNEAYQPHTLEHCRKYI